MLDKARHGVAEYKETDDLIEELENTDYSNPLWVVRLKDLKATGRFPEGTETCP